MGMIPSVSLPSVKTCVTCACNTKCYSRRLERLRPTVKKAYEDNLDAVTNNPDAYWANVEAVVSISRHFRFHVGGDIPNAEYFARMVSLAKKHPLCKLLCFTKKYSIVNDYLRTGSPLPDNLKIIFSEWIGLEMSNPFLLPEAHVIFKGSDPNPKWTICHGNCAECASQNIGCWSMKSGDHIAFFEH